MKTELIKYLKMLINLGIAMPLALMASGTLLAQQVTLSIGSGSAARATSVTIPIIMSSSAGAQPAAFQWTMGYSSSDISSVSVTAGSSATSAGKNVTCNSSSTATTCIASGLNMNTISGGTVANATFTIAAGAVDTTVPVQITGVMATDMVGTTSFSTSGTGGILTILQPGAPTLSGLSCAPTSVSAGGVAVCTVTLSGVALTGGVVVGLTSNNSNATVQASVTVIAGAASAAFMASVSTTVPTAQTAVLTASAAGVSQTFSLSLVAASTWTISGSVGASAGGATITLTGASTMTTTANSSGAYAFSGLTNGSYTVTPSLSNFTFTPASLTITVSGASQTGINFQGSVNGFGTPFITGYTTAGRAVRNDFSGWVGAMLTVGSNALNVSSVGRLCLAGNLGTHTVKFAANGQDVPGGSALVNMSGCTAGQFIYTNLPSPISLQPGVSYVLASQEVSGGDLWYDSGPVSTTGDAAVNDAVFYNGSWINSAGANTAFVPPNFEYSVATGSAYITGYTTAGRAVRNDFGGWVGARLTVGSASLTVNSIGRLCLTGNLGSHTVKFAANGQDVPGGSVQVNMAGCTAGQFVYSALPSTISLQPGVTYELASLEVSGGDTWYDSGPVSTTADAAVNDAVFYNGSWINSSGANTSYVPPNFQYSVSGGSVAPGAPYITGYTTAGRAVRNDFGGWVGARLTVGSSALNVSSIGRLCLAGNSSTHTVKFAANGQDVPGGSAQVNMAGCTAGQFVYSSLSSTISLQPGVTYELASQEVSGGDTWYDSGPVSTTADAAVNDAVFYNGSWINSSGANTSFVPPNFQYTVATGIVVTSAPYITGYTTAGRAVRNDFGGWVGVRLTVGSSSLTVTSIGRLCLAGNLSTHTVKFSANGQDVPGGSVVVNMAGCTPGQFVYTALPSTISLQSGVSYVLASQEVSGGDTWYDSGPVSATADAAVNDAVFYNGSWINENGANTSFVPPNFLYHL
jgi:hypothetical protein